MKVLGISIPFIGRTSTSLKNAQNQTTQNTSVQSKQRQSYKLKINKIYLSEIDQQTLKDAIIAAENPYQPDRSILYALYKETLRDFHLRSQIRTAENEVISEATAIVSKQNKEINKELTELLQTEWFEKCCRLYLEAEWWGHSLIEFGELILDEDTNSYIFKEVKLIPREHVRPETGELLINPGDSAGIPYREAPFNEWLIETCEKEDLGLLEVATKYSIYKKYGIADWARSGEKWGDPLLIIRSASDDEAENTKKEEFASNFGNNGYAIVDIDDEIELLERQNGTGYQIFKDFISTMNDENSKGVNGQTATSDNQAWAGTADVQEKILNGYTETRLRGLMYWVNNVVIPKLIHINNGNSAYAKLKGFVWMPICFMREIKTPDQIAQEKQIQTQQQNIDPNQNNLQTKKIKP